jgi:hypothetical protein
MRNMVHKSMLGLDEEESGSEGEDQRLNRVERPMMLRRGSDNR